MTIRALTAALLLSLAPAASAQIPRITIPGPLDGPLPRFTGAPATAQPLDGPFLAQSTALAPDGRSGSGLAAGNGAASPMPGPLGNATSRLSSLQFGTCTALAFDRADRVVANCNGVLGPSLRVIDPSSLATLAMLVLPPRPNADRADTAGGTHFIVRADGTLLVPANDGTVISVAAEGGTLRKLWKVSLAGVLAAGERPFAVTATEDGREWVAGTAGTVVAMTRGGGQLKALALGEPVTEDLAADSDGVTVATATAVYRLSAGADGTPVVRWRHALSEPSGTPPVLLPGGFVALTEGARVIALRGDDGSSHCSVPVFAQGAGRITAHLVGAGRSVVVANAHGYDNPLVTEGGNTTTGGLARVDIGAEGCTIAWTSPEISPSAQSVVSRATGLLYTLVKPAGFPDAWNLAAIDWRTGATRFTALAGEGLGHNSEGGPLVLARDGTAFAGTFGGLLRFRG